MQNCTYRRRHAAHAEVVHAWQVDSRDEASVHSSTDRLTRLQVPGAGVGAAVSRLHTCSSHRTCSPLRQRAWVSSSVCPGAVAGPRLDRIVKQQAETLRISEADSMRLFSDAAALKRPTTASEVAAACVFLASDASSGITGEDLNVSAGVVMY